MNEQLIRKNIADRLGIDKLNDMQVSMTDVNAPLSMLIAPTGSGKTVAFTIAALRYIKPPCGHLQVVIIAPSRELVLQIYEVVRPVATGYKTVAMYGGHNMQDETNSIQVMPDIIVATPGRLVDHIKRGNLPRGNHLRCLVLDEYDKALELGFSDEMRRILRFFTAPDHVILTSATAMDELPDYLPPVAPHVLDFSSSGKTSPRRNMHIIRILSPARDKLDTLIGLLSHIGSKGDAPAKVIVFLNHRESVERVYRALRKLRFPTGIYHGGLDQLDREKAIALLNNGTTPILVSTDLASRGLDIDNVDAVVHYHLPPSQQAWVHRNGRTARAGAKGEAFIITSDGEDMPEYVEFDSERAGEEYLAADGASPRQRIAPTTATLYFNLGKKEKISRGDIVGFLVKIGGLAADEIGHIDLKDHCALVAIPASRLSAVLSAVANQKIKNKKVKITKIQ